MYIIWQSFFVALVCTILALDFYVFIRCQTYKQGTSLMISICLVTDLLCRLAQLCYKIKQLRNDQVPYPSYVQIAFHDITAYLISVVLLALLAQWSWIYLVLKNPVKAAKMSKSFLIEKLLFVAIIYFSLLIVNDLIAMVITILNTGKNAYLNTIVWLTIIS
jgi:hypothetical protein